MFTKLWYNGAKKGGDIVQFILTFSAIYFISTILGQNMHIFTPDPKMLRIKSPITYAILTFPYSAIGVQKVTHGKERGLTLSELLFCISNQMLIVGAVILQIIPSVPCEVIEISFGRHHRWLDITLSTYNQKIPLALICAVLCLELLFLFGEICIRAIRNADFRKKLGAGTLIGLLALCLLFLAGLVFFVFLLF